MPDIDFTSAYRDATQGSTIKALGQRRAELQAALAARKPREVNSPWQGAAEVADSISGSIREGRLANQEAAGRQRFAELLAGGLAPDEIGEAMGLDPETTMKYQERTWAKEDKGEERSYQEGRDARLHGYDVEAATARVKAERDAATERARVEAAGQDDQQAAALVLADHNASIDEKKAAQKVIDDAKVAQTTVTNDRETTRLSQQQQSDLDITEKRKQAEIEAGQPQTEEAKIMADFANKKYGDPTSPEAIKLRDDALAKATHIPPSASTNQDRTALWKQQDAYANTSATAGQLQEAKNILTQGINWGRFEGPLKTQAGASGYGSKENQETAQRTLRYNTIMGGQALLSLAETLKGASSDKDVAVFMEIMNNPAMDPTRKAQAIDDMLAKVASHQELERTRILELGGNLPDEPAKMTPEEKIITLDNARKAIAAKPEAADMIKKRLAENGIDASEL